MSQQPVEEDNSIFSKLRDSLYNIVYSEGDFALQFIADLIHGPDAQRDAGHVKRQLQHQERNSTVILTEKEKAIFMIILSRKAGEEQVAYWKRKKLLLQHPNKKELVQNYITAQQDKKNSQKAQTTDLSLSDKNTRLEEYQQITKAKQQHKNAYESKCK